MKAPYETPVVDSFDEEAFLSDIALASSPGCA